MAAQRECHQVDNPIEDSQVEPPRRKYNIEITDKDHLMESHPSTSRGDSLQRTYETWSDQRYSVQRTIPVKRDTLWLKARDFAAHAVIMSRADRCPSPLRPIPRINPYADNARIFSVTLPRDYDGYQWGGTNRGDYMADQWEESVFGFAQGDTNIKNFFPFLNIGPRGFYERNSFGWAYYDSIADRDTFAVGRGIRGDGLTNWEEYRGFWTTGDYNTYPYATPQYERMDPRHKNIFKALSPRLEPDLVLVMPAWDSLLYEPQFDATDPSQYLDMMNIMETYLLK